MNLATLLFPRGLPSSPSSLSNSMRQLLQRAECIKNELPEPSPGSQVTVAFGHDHEGFVASLLGSTA
jgi:hypothetical protein